MEWCLAVAQYLEDTKVNLQHTWDIPVNSPGSCASMLEVGDGWNLIVW